MQTSFTPNPEIAMAGTQYGPRQSAPYTLAFLPQIDTITIADASPSAGESWTIRVVDDETSQTYSVDFLSGASLAATLDNAVAALVANGNTNNLFTFAEDGATVLTPTARHGGRSYTWSVPTVGGSATAVVATTQESGGNKLEFGLMYARSSTAGEFRALNATDAVIDLAGILFRTDANHLRDVTEEPDPTAFDGARRGWTMSLMEQGRCWVRCEAAVTDTTSGVFVRRATTSGSGTVGAFRTAAAGGQQLYTITPAAINLAAYGFTFSYLGENYTVLYEGDGSTTLAQAATGLVFDAGTIAGLTITDTTGALTIQTAAGTEITNMRPTAASVDTPAASVTIVETTAEDVDTIDVSAFVRWERTSVTLADGTIIAPVRLGLPG